VKTNLTTLTEDSLLLDVNEFQKVVEHSSVAITLGLPDGTILLANESAVALFGYSSEEFLLINREQLFLHDEQYETAINRRDKGLSDLGELIAIKKNGTHFNCQVYSTFFTDMDGTVKSSSIIIDTSVHQMDSIQSIHKFILDNIEETLLLLNKELNIVAYTKASAIGIKKFLKQDLIKGMCVLDLVPKERRADLRTLYEKVLEGQAQTSLSEFIDDKGQIAYYENRYKPVYNSDKEIIGVLVIAHNITEQRKTEQQIQSTEQRWRFALEGSNQGVWDWNIKTGKTYYSPTWKKLLGFEEHEIEGDISEWRNLLHAEDAKFIETAIEEHTHAEDPFKETIQRLRTKNGDYKWILARGMVVEKDEAGNAVRMIGTHTDITDQKNIEEGYKQLFYSHPLPMWIYDVETLKVVEVNTSALRQYGYTEEEFLSLTIKDLRPAEDVEILFKYIETIDGDYSQSRGPLRHKKKNGEIIYVEITSNTLHYKGHRCRLVSVNDITKKVIAENALKKSNERFEHASRAASEALWEWDIENDTLYISPAYTTILGHQVEANRKYAEWHNYIHPDDREQTLLSFYASIDNPDVDKWEKEYRYRKADDTYAFVVDRAVILRSSEGKAIKVVGAIQDISNRKLAEEELRKSNERFELAGKATSDAIWDWDLTTNEVHWGRGLYALFGYKENIDTASWGTMIHANDRLRVEKSLEFTLFSTAKRYWKEEYQFKDAHGNYRYVLDRGFIIRDEDRKPLRMIGAMQDITERRRKEEELEQSNERFEMAALATSDIVWDLDLTTNKIQLTDHYTKAFGHVLPGNKVQNLDNVIALVHPDDQKRLTSAFTRAIESTLIEKFEEEFRFQKSNGSYAFVSNRGFIMRNEGKAIRIIGAMSDITDKKYQQDILSLELRVFETSAIPNISFGNVMRTFLQGFEYIHPDIQAMLVLKQENEASLISTKNIVAHQQHLLECIIRNGKKNFHAHNRKHLIVADLSEEYSETVLPVIKQNNWKLLWIIPIQHMNGNDLGYFTIFLKNIQVPTEAQINILIRLRNLLRILIVNDQYLFQVKSSNERYNMMLQATHDMIWDWNLETGSFYRNEEGLRKVYGVKDNQSIQSIHNWMDRVHPDDYYQVQKVINDILNASELDKFEMEYRFKKDNGDYSHVYDRGIIIKNAQGKPVRMIGAAQDISDRKRLEDELVRKELERQKVINQVSIDTQEQERREIGKELHDNVNQILTTTKLYLDLSLTNHEMKDELIRKSSDNVIYVINEIRQLSRSLMDPTIGDLGLIYSLRDLVESINLTKKLSVSLQADELIDDCLQSSQKLSIFRIVQEALNNIIKYAKASNASVSLKMQNGNVMMVVKDNGKGFDLKQVRKGAGLINIQNRIYLMNGTLEIETKPDHGCSLNIQFPINQTN
jgi:PAS domain S-box-containing protein